MGGRVAGHTSGDRGFRLGEDGRVGNGSCGASRLGDATGGSLGPAATTRHGVDHNAVVLLTNILSWIGRKPT